MTNYLQATIAVTSESEAEVLIALLSDIGFDSFQEEAGVLQAYIEENKLDEELLRSILSERQLSYSLEKIESKNWNEEWEKNFQPVTIDNFCSIRAAFHEPNKLTQHEIIITPKMSFGTGHHATTYLMLDQMRDMQFENVSVLDFGTGTGILAIMAEKLGAEQILAIDIDEWSIFNATENIAANNCRKVQLVQADNIPPNKSFKIMLANINRNVILENLPGMCKTLAANGEILLSGLMVADFEQVHALADKLGLYLQRKGEKSGWIALRYVSHT